jgi:hypothetical protein
MEEAGLTTFITKGSQLRFRGSELLCLGIPLLVEIVPLLQRLVKARLPTCRASLLRRQATERDAQLFQLGRQTFVQDFGAFVIKERLAETLD